jgi:hypothetical protein
LMTVFSVAVITLGMPAALVLTRQRAKISGAASHSFGVDQASALSFDVWASLPERAHPKTLALFV